jgi:DNA repair protein RadC
VATATLRAAGDLIGIRIVDHIVVTEDAHCSIRADEGWA